MQLIYIDSCKNLSYNATVYCVIHIHSRREPRIYQMILKLKVRCKSFQHFQKRSKLFASFSFRASFRCWYIICFRHSLLVKTTYFCSLIGLELSKVENIAKKCKAKTSIMSSLIMKLVLKNLNEIYSLVLAELRFLRCVLYARRTAT